MAAPTLQAEGSLNVVTTGNNTPTIPTHQADDILLVAVGLWAPNSTEFALLSFTAPTDWAKIADKTIVPVDQIDGRIAWFWRRASGSGTTVTITRPGGDTGTDTAFGARAYVIRGCITTGDPWDEAIATDPYAGANGAVSAVTVSGTERTVIHFLVRTDDYSTAPTLSGWTAGTALESTTGTDHSQRTFRKDNVSSSTTADTMANEAVAAGGSAALGVSFKPPSSSVSSSFSANAVVKATPAGSFTADAIVKKTSSSSFTANAIVKKTMPGTVVTNYSRQWRFTSDEEGWAHFGSDDGVYGWDDLGGGGDSTDGPGWLRWRDLPPPASQTTTYEWRYFSTWGDLFGGMAPWERVIRSGFSTVEYYGSGSGGEGFEMADMAVDLPLNPNEAQYLFYASPTYVLPEWLTSSEVFGAYDLTGFPDSDRRPETAITLRAKTRVIADSSPGLVDFGYDGFTYTARTSGTPVWTMDAEIVATLGATADAVIQRTLSATFSADAVVKKSIAGSAALDAIVSRTVSSSATLDAIIQGAVGGSITADAALQKTFGASATADALLATSQTGSFLASSLVQSTIVAASSVDAVLFRTQTHTRAADAVIRSTRSDSFTDDAILLATVFASATADAVSKATLIASGTANAVLRRTQTTSFSSDAVLQAVAQESFTADGIVDAPVTAGITAGSVIKTTSTAVLNSDAVLRASVIGGASADAYLYLPSAGDSFAADAIVLAPQAGGLTASAWILGTGVFAFDADAVVRGSGADTFSADARISVSRATSFSADAVIFRVQSGQGTLNAVTRAESLASFIGDAILLAEHSQGATANAVALAGRTGVFAAGGIVVAAQSGSTVADARIRSITTGVLTLDAYFVGTPTAGFTADAVVSGATEHTFGADAVLDYAVLPPISAVTTILRIDAVTAIAMIEATSTFLLIESTNTVSTTDADTSIEEIGYQDG